MSRPLPLTAYLALQRSAGGTEASDGETPPVRPEGPLLWAQVPDAAAAASARQVASSLQGLVPRLSLLLTGPGAAADGRDGLFVLRHRVPEIIQPLPIDTASAARAFVDHWRPDALIWVGADLRPGLLDATRSRQMIRLLVSPGAGPYVTPNRFLVPGVVRAILPLFERAFCHLESELDRLQRSGFRSSNAEVCGRFETLAPTLPFVESDYEDLAETLGTRPIWLAMPAYPAELSAIVAAHRSAVRLAHRLVLVLAAPDPGAVAAHPALNGLSVANRWLGEDVTGLTEVIVTDTDEPGLWFRLSPLCFAGGTFGGGSVETPFAAAALGSVVLHGPETGAMRADFERLDPAGAAVAVATGDGLTSQVERFLSPERAAAAAHAAWDVVTSGAEATNRVAEVLGSHFEARSKA